MSERTACSNTHFERCNGINCPCYLDGRASVGEVTRPKRPHKNTNLTGCQSRLYWQHGVAAKCRLPVNHGGHHTNSTRVWDDEDAAENAARFGRDSQ